MKKKKQLTLSAIGVLLVAAPGLLIVLFTARAATSTLLRCQPPVMAAAKPVQSPALSHASVLVAKTAAPATGNPGLLDRRHQFALGMIETGNDDGEIGGAGEVSRYQIMPSVWQCYSPSRNYRDPQVSLALARRHWAVLYDSFKQKAGREPTDFDMYVALEHALRLLFGQALRSRPPLACRSRPRPALRQPRPVRRCVRIKA